MTDQIPAFLANVQWKEEKPPERPVDGLPSVTHSGVLNLFGHDLRCFRLSDGRAIFHADDFEAFADKFLAGELEEAKNGRQIAEFQSNASSRIGLTTEKVQARTGTAKWLATLAIAGRWWRLGTARAPELAT